MTEIKCGRLNWENHCFQIQGNKRSLEINQKVTGSAVIPSCGNEILLISIKRADGKIHLEIPRGFRKSKESLVKTAIRELKEETNLNVKYIDELGTVMPDSGISNSSIHLYLAEVDSFDNIVVQKSEHINDYVVLNYHTLRYLINNNTITDGFTLSAILKVLAKKDFKQYDFNDREADDWIEEKYNKVTVWPSVDGEVARTQISENVYTNDAGVSGIDRSKDSIDLSGRFFGKDKD